MTQLGNQNTGTPSFKVFKIKSDNFCLHLHHNSSNAFIGILSLKDQISQCDFP